MVGFIGLLAAAVCLIALGIAEKVPSLRVYGGVVAAVAALTAIVALTNMDVPRGWRGD